MSRLLMSNDVLLESVRQMLGEGHTVTLRVAGYSMRPLLEHRRDSVLLTVKRKCQLHDVVLAKVAPGQYVLHRVVSLEGELVTLMGDGNLHGQEHCRLADVVGVAILFHRKGRRLSCDARIVKCYVYVWLRLRPIRKWLLLVYRANLKIFGSL